MWKLLVGALVVVGLVRATWRQRLVLLAISFLAVAIPVILVTHQARVLGVVWQGRDGMPLTVGGVILAASLCAKAGRATTIERGVSIAVVAIVSLLDMVAFFPTCVATRSGCMRTTGSSCTMLVGRHLPDSS